MRHISAVIYCSDGTQAESHEWRIVYRMDPTQIIVAHHFAKKGKSMQQREFVKAKKILAMFDIANS